MLKYKLLITRETYLLTHPLRRLIKGPGEVDSRVLTLISDLRNLHYVARLEEPYIAMIFEIPPHRVHNRGGQGRCQVCLGGVQAACRVSAGLTSTTSGIT